MRIQTGFPIELTPAQLQTLRETEVRVLSGFSPFSKKDHVVPATALVQALGHIACLEGRWVPWKLGDPVPPVGEYRVTAYSPHVAGDPYFTRECNVVEANNIYARRFDWPYMSRIVAYWSRPLPPVWKPETKTPPE